MRLANEARTEATVICFKQEQLHAELGWYREIKVISSQDFYGMEWLFILFRQL